MITDFADKRDLIARLHRLALRALPHLNPDDRAAVGRDADLLTGIDEDLLRFAPLAARIAVQEDRELTAAVNESKTRARIAARQWRAA